jgi:SAM-dependent methyltransferase
MLNHKKIYNKNEKIYKQKKLIRLIYDDYYKKIKKNLYKINKHKIIEFGSGGGNIKKIIPKCITSDKYKGDNIDRVENIYKINFKNKSISNIILLDVFHHLEFPNLALEEVNRVLITNGRIIMIEPAMGFIPRVIYKLFHYEPNGFDLNINWKKIPKKIQDTKNYFAAQSLPWRIFFLKEVNLKKYKIEKVSPFSDFAFLFSGGYSYNSFYPVILYPLIKLIDKLLTRISIKTFSARMLIILKKRN